MDALEHIISEIERRDTRHGKKLRANLEDLTPELRRKANRFMSSYETFTKERGHDISYGIDSYLWMINMMMYEQIQFLRTGEYSCKSFADAEREVYSNSDLMDQYMHGLMLSQFLWKHHYKVFDFFLQMMEKYRHANHPRRYLEIGGGHGLYLREAKQLLGPNLEYTCVDISASSIEMARSFLQDEAITFIQQDIFSFQSDPFDLITMGEVLEHVEDPRALLQCVGDLLSDDGVLFITTPTNAATIDHIYLFKSRDEIVELIQSAGFDVLDEYSIYSEDVTEERATKLKVPMMYAAIIRPH